MNKETLNANYYISHPEILQDIAYVKINLSNIKLKFSEYPDSIQKNPFFVYEYFSRVETNKKEYKHIPSQLLKDPFFINSCLKLNPDIYLLADPSCHTECAFLALKEYHPTSYLKYAKESDLNNSDFCMEALKVSEFNYAYLPDKMKRNWEIIKKVFYYESYASLLTKEIPKDLIKDRKFVESLLDVSISAFPHLPSQYRDDPEIAFKVVSKNTTCFSSVSERLRSDKDWIENLINYKKNADKQYRFEAVRMLSIEEILLNIPAKLFVEIPSICEDYSEKIRSIYPKLNKEVRMLHNVLKAVYDYDVNKVHNTSLYQSSFLNKIPDETLAKQMKELIKNQDNTNFYKEIPSKMVKLIDSYFLHKDLKENLSVNQTTTKIIKI